MKNFLLLLPFIILMISCENKNEVVNDVTSKENSSTKSNKFNIVHQEEYEQASDQEKKIYDKINAAVVALDKLNDESYEATIYISNNKNRTIFSDKIIISKQNKNDIAARDYKRGICTVCGVSSAYKCLNKLKKIKDDEFDVHVKKKGSCVSLTW